MTTDMEDSMGPQIKMHKRTTVFGHWTRYVILTVSTICLTLLTSNSLILNFTIICMSDDGPLTNSTAFDRLPDEVPQRYHYSPTEKGLLFSAVALGTLSGTIPVVRLSSVIGIRRLFTAFGMVSAISTIALPVAAKWGFPWLFAARFLEGFALAISYPVIGSIAAQWSPLADSGMYLSLLSCHFQLGPMLTMPLSGALCVSSMGWQSTYYILGGATIVAFTVFFFAFRDSPRFHSIVSEKELKVIEQGKDVIVKRQQKAPYRRMLKSIRIWAIWALCTGGTFGFQLFFQYAPIYLNKVLHFEVEKTGIATALPYLFSMLIKILTGPLSDHAPYLSEKARVMAFAFLSQGTMAFSFLLLALIPAEMSAVGQIAYTLAIAFSGMNWAGGVKCAQLVARQHVHFVLAVLSVITCSIVLVLPAIVSTIAPNNTHQEWATIFYLCFGLIVVCNIFFGVVIDTTPAKWTLAKASTTTVYTITNLEDGDLGKKKVSDADDGAEPVET